jgi:hypothetical protein
LKRGLKNVGDRGGGRGESTALFYCISMTRPNVSMRMALDFILYLSSSQLAVHSGALLCSSKAT